MQSRYILKLFAPVALACIIMLTGESVVSNANTAAAEEAGWKAIGLRAGIDDGRNDEDMTQVEAFALYDLPWNWKFESDWSLFLIAEFNAGALNGGGDTAFVGSVGPGISVRSPGNSLAFRAGINPTVISEDAIGDEDLGGPVQFTSHVGLSYTLPQLLSIGYRFQHMSNAGIYSPNPGVNLHMVEIGYHF